MNEKLTRFRTRLEVSMRVGTPVRLDGLKPVGGLNLAVDDELPHPLALFCDLFLRRAEHRLTNCINDEGNN